jgi:signal transduction histidine kinase
MSQATLAAAQTNEESAATPAPDARAPQLHDPSSQAVTIERLRGVTGDAVVFQITDPLAVVAEAFAKRPDLAGVLVLDGQRLAAVLSNRAVSFNLSKGYFRELYVRKPLSVLLENWKLRTLMLSSDSPIPDAIACAMARDPEERYEPIVVREADGALFLLEMQVLLDEQCRQLSSALAAVERQRRTIEAHHAERERLSAKLVETSRQAGMAQIASSILHNVGNVLNSVNTSASVLCEKTRQMRVGKLGQAAAMIVEHRADLSDFLTTDQRGKAIPDYLVKLAELLGDDQQQMLAELQNLSRSVEHIDQIIKSQQTYATGVLAVEAFEFANVVEDSLRMIQGSINKHQITIVRNFAELPTIRTDKHMVMQIVVNLLTNAKQALRDHGTTDPRITLTLDRTQRNGKAMARLTVTDNGAGIESVNLSKIFTHGFTTRSDGHGLGLHNAANAAGQMGGALTAHSDGPGTGASFELELPLHESKGD